MSAPTATTLDLGAIPGELRERAQWVLWRFEQRDGKTTKVPYRADGGGRASSTDPATWSSFGAAVAGHSALRADGIGFVFTADDPYVGVDLDAGISEAERAEILRTLDSYAETSVGGSGVHVIVRASLNGHARNRRGPIEVYEAGRYFVVTGAHVPGAPTTVETRQDELADVLERFLPAPAPVDPRDREAVAPVDLDDRELLERAFRAKNGARLEALWNGDTSAHGGDDSVADLALCGALAFWTAGDAARIDSLFRRSGLMRPKWDDRRGESTYGAQTIETALAGQTDFYQPPAARKPPISDSETADSAPKPASAYRRTDTGNAELFADRHSGRLRYVKERRQWHAWEAGRWRLDVTGEADRAMKATVRERLRAAADIDDAGERGKEIAWTMSSESDARIRGALSRATNEDAIVLRAEQLDADPFLLACGNGAIDLRTGNLRPANPADLISLGTDVAFEPDAHCERWRRFLDEIFDGDAQLAAWWQRLAGYCLTGDTREQVVVIAHGLGCNGKDTALRQMARILGDLAVTTPADSFTRSRGDKGVRNDLARLHRARLVIASEAGHGRRLDEATVKLLSGGGRVAARFLYGEFFEYVPGYKIVLLTNAKPRIDGDDEGIWRRLRLVPFAVSFKGREDRTLDAQLEAELPGILAWAVQGCLAWQREGLGETPAVTRATDAYRAEEDLLGAFLAERCTPDGWAPVAPFREVYDAYCRDLGEQAEAPSVLGKRLSQRGIRRATRDGTAAYLGVTLR